MRINGHGHILPEPFQIPSFMKEKKLFWIDDDKKFMRQGDWSRPINGPGFFIKERIEWMNQHNIDHGVMLCLSQLYCNGWKEQDCTDGIRFQNDFNASIQSEYREKFTCGFVVQPLYMDHALKEIERCVNELGLKLLCLPTHFLNAKGEWLSTAEAEVDPIFEQANNCGLAVQIHPYDGDKMIALKNQFQSKRIGSLFMVNIVNYFKKIKDVEYITCETYRENAIRFYTEKCGFEVFGKKIRIFKNLIILKMKIK